MLNHARLWVFLWIMLLLPLKDTVPAEAFVRTADSLFLQQPDHDSITSGTGLREQSDRKEERITSSTLTLSQLMKKYPDTFRTRGPRMKQIALTFDDVPDPRFTPQVLDILKKEGVKATFFAVGDRVRKHPHLVARITRDGHSIGNHSYNHALFSKLSLEQFRGQIERTNQIIKSITGISPRLIRPPYGDINEEQLRWARKNNYKIVNWNVDSLDWKGLSKNEVKQNILSAAGPGAIVLQHAGGGIGSDLTGTIEALPEVISELRRKGYRFVTLPEMLGVKESL